MVTDRYPWDTKKKRRMQLVRMIGTKMKQALRDAKEKVKVSPDDDRNRELDHRDVALHEVAECTSIDQCSRPLWQRGEIESVVFHSWNHLLST